jgi:hypothetical protein
VCHGTVVIPATSLARRFPAVAAQWHPTKNGELTPDRVVAASGKRVWWKCPKGPDHEWEARVIERTRLRARGKCPFCANQRVSVTNSLATLHPKIAAEWHPTRNGELTPDRIVSGSNQRVWWKCPKGPDHEWDGPVGWRTRASSAGMCVFCANQRASVTNSLATLNPKLAREWHPTMNKPLLPSMVLSKSGKKVWWKCQFGHVWQALISSRACGSGCPVCARHRKRKVAVTRKRRRTVRLPSQDAPKAAAGRA